MVGDGSNIGAQFDPHNRAVGRVRDPFGKAHCHCFRVFRAISGGVECHRKWGAGDGAASRPDGDESPHHKGFFPT